MKGMLLKLRLLCMGNLTETKNTHLCASNTPYPIKPTVKILNSHLLDFLRHSVFPESRNRIKIIYMQLVSRDKISVDGCQVNIVPKTVI